MTHPNKTYIIAEMACSHEGDPALARTIIDAAAQAGADAIQFQIWIASHMMVPHHPAYPTLLHLEMPHQTWRELAEYTRQHYPDIHIIACIYEHASLDFCEHIGVDAYKLHAADLTNPSFIAAVAATGRRVDLSVGAATLNEIQTAVQCIHTTSSSPVWLMYGYQNFPTPTDAIHMRFMATLQHLFGLPVGYQDHSDAESEAAFWLPAAAAGMGIAIQEKHITHDRSYKGADHQAALNPDEFIRFVQMLRTIDAAHGNARPRPFLPEEEHYRAYARKCIVARRDLAPGTVVTKDDVLFMRADRPGLPPDQVQRLLGHCTRRAIPAYHVMCDDDVEKEL